MGAIKAMRALLGVILCLVLGMSIWLVSQRQVLEQEEVSLFGLTLRQVKDTSMAPALSPGDLAVTVPREEYGLGDAVLCQDQEGKSFQRLVGSTGDSFIARGDGEGEEAEALLSPETIQGAVVASLPGAGTVYEFLSSWWGPPVVLVIGVLLLALPTLLGLGRHKEVREEEFSTRKPRTVEKTVQEKPGRYRGRHAR